MHSTSASSLPLLRAAATWPLPGLGLLALPDGPTPHLLTYSLHTTLAVRVIISDGSRWFATATVEEIIHGAAPERALLLDFAPLPGPAQLLPGTEIWLRDGVSDVSVLQ